MRSSTGWPPRYLPAGLCLDVLLCLFVDVNDVDLVDGESPGDDDDDEY